MTCDHDRIYTDAINLFGKIKKEQSIKLKSRPLIWMSDELYNELKSEGIIKEQTNER